MPYLIALLGLISAAGYWIWRMRAAAVATRELGDVAANVLAAARRLGFQRRLNTHPVDSVEDPALAISAIGIAFLELSGLPSSEQHAALAGSIGRHTGADAARTEEMLIVGRWLVSESNGPQSAIPRLSKRLHKLDPTAFRPLLAVLNDVGQSGSGGLTTRQREALDDIARMMKLR